MKTQKKIKVVMLSPALDAVSGISTHVNMLLASALVKDYEIMHFQVGREGRDESTSQRLMRFAVSPFQLAAVMLKKRPRIVHINTAMDMKAFCRDLLFLIVARLSGVIVVTQFHSGFGPQSRFSHPILSWTMRRFLLWSHAVIVLSSEAMREHRVFDARIKLDFVPNAINTSGLLDSDRHVNDDRALKLVFVGRLVRTKGLFEAIEAVALLKKERIPCSFRIAGSGPDEQGLRNIIAERGLEQEVLLLGPVFGETKIQLWLDSDVLVFPTHFEGLPYSLLEAMAAGCVPVTCSVGGIPDVMCDGVHGLFVPLNDPRALATAIRRLAEDRCELSRMSQAGRQRIAEHYTVDRLATRFGEIYERVS